MRSFTYVSQQLFHDVRLAAQGRRFDSILEQAVLLAQSNALIPPLVLAVNVGGNLAEEDEVMALKPLSEVDGIVVVVVLDGIAQSLVILFLDQEIIDGV